MTHGCSPFTVTRRNLTPLDVVTAHSVLPGRDDVALLLEESMRGEGWTGGRMEHKRRLSEQRMKRKERKREVRDGINKVFSVNPTWWDLDSDSDSSDFGSEDEEGEDGIYVSTLHILSSRLSLTSVIDTLTRLFVHARVFSALFTLYPRLAHHQFSTLSAKCHASLFFIHAHKIRMFNL
jgi:hypothetical protein